MFTYYFTKRIYCPSFLDHLTDPNNGGTDPSEFGYNHYRVGIPVTIDTVIIPTMYFVNRFDNEIANLLRDDATKLKNISRLYGFYPVESAEKTTMDTYIHRISSVSILGFDFSRASFSFVLMILTLVFYSLLFSEVQKLGNITLKNYLNFTGQHTMGLLIEMNLARFFAWVVSPFIFLIVVISNFIVVLPLLTYSVAILICTTIFILGLKSYLRISKLK